MFFNNSTNHNNSGAPSVYMFIASDSVPNPSATSKERFPTDLSEGYQKSSERFSSVGYPLFADSSPTNVSDGYSSTYEPPYFTSTLRPWKEMNQTAVSEADRELLPVTLRPLVNSPLGRNLNGSVVVSDPEASEESGTAAINDSSREDPASQTENTAAEGSATNPLSFRRYKPRNFVTSSPLQSYYFSTFYPQPGGNYFNVFILV